MSLYDFASFKNVMKKRNDQLKIKMQTTLNIKKSENKSNLYTHINDFELPEDFNDKNLSIQEKNDILLALKYSIDDNSNVKKQETINNHENKF